MSADQSLHYFYVHTFYVNNVFLLLKNYLLFTYDDSGGVYLDQGKKTGVIFLPRNGELNDVNRRTERSHLKVFFEDSRTALFY